MNRHDRRSLRPVDGEDPVDVHGKLAKKMCALASWFSWRTSPACARTRACFPEGELPGQARGAARDPRKPRPRQRGRLCVLRAARVAGRRGAGLDADTREGQGEARGQAGGVGEGAPPFGFPKSFLSPERGKNTPFDAWRAERAEEHTTRQPWCERWSLFKYSTWLLFVSFAKQKIKTESLLSRLLRAQRGGGLVPRSGPPARPAPGDEAPPPCAAVSASRGLPATPSLSAGRIFGGGAGGPSRAVLAVLAVFCVSVGTRAAAGPRLGGAVCAHRDAPPRSTCRYRAAPAAPARSVHDAHAVGTSALYASQNVRRPRGARLYIVTVASGRGRGRAPNARAMPRTSIRSARGGGGHEACRVVTRVVIVVVRVIVLARAFRRRSRRPCREHARGRVRPEEPRAAAGTQRRQPPPNSSPCQLIRRRASPWRRNPALLGPRTARA